ncbi:MAG: GNAT family N-acetyltransferase [Ginsengibacter sp.]
MSANSDIVFTTERTFLRQFTIRDAALIRDLNGDPEVVKFLHEPLLQNDKQALTMLLTILLPQYKNKLGRWAIYTKNGNVFIGWCGLKYRSDLEEIDLGYRLKKSAWGMGFATEAASATLEHGFRNLNIPLITGRAHIDNTSSIRVLEKIGMHFIREEIVDDCPVRTYILANPYL